jgi:hypothetical protein
MFHVQKIPKDKEQSKSDNIVSKSNKMFKLEKIKKNSKIESNQGNRSKLTNRIFYIAKIKSRLKRRIRFRRGLDPNFSTGRWSTKEQIAFLESCLKYKNNWREVI